MKEYEIDLLSARMRVYLHDRIENDKPYPRPAVIILPGGAYEYISPREGEPVALKFLSSGYQAFILEYTTGRENIEKNEPEVEVQEAVSYIRAHSKKMDVIEDKIVLLGFSAGGHLALSSQCHEKRNHVNALVLCYPVITTGKFGHSKSTYNLTGGDGERMKYYSLENHVSSYLPPVFVWHTREDKSVSAMNTALLVEALIRENVPYECHIFQKGGHGLSICTNDVNSREENTSLWLPLVLSWLERLFNYKQ